MCILAGGFYLLLVTHQREKMPENDFQSESILEKWYKDFTGDKPPASLLRTSDPRLREQAGIIYRGLGFILCLIVIYLSVFDFFRSNVEIILIGLSIYVLYLLLLEWIRFQKRAEFDSSWFRILRISINVIAITWLIYVPSNAKSIIGLFYTVPIFAAIIYFPNNRKTITAIILSSLLLLYGGGMAFNSTNPLSTIQLLFIMAALLIFSYGFYWFHNNVIFGADIISQVAVQLHKILELEDLAAYIVKTTINLARADRALIIIVDPSQKSYIKHAEHGFDIKEGFSFEDIAENCYVINNGAPFDCHNMETYYNNKDIYSKYFNCSPQSVFATPLFNRDHAVIGVLNVASDKTNKFDQTTKDFISGFSYLVSSAVENGLIYRQVKLNEIKSRDLTRIFAEARDEQEIFDLILSETRSIFPGANCLIHKLENSILKNLEDVTLNPLVWDAGNYNDSSGKPASFRYGSGLAGHALKLREPILANDVNKDPRYLKYKADSDINSLLVCPLYNPSSDENYGVINLFSDQLGAFTPDDEISITSLAHQASLALAKMGEFEKWQEQGGILRKILNEVRFFDFGASDEVFCNQVAETATKLLGFKIARIRLLDTKSDELVTVAFSAPYDHSIKDLIGHRMPLSALDPFISSKYEAERSYIIPQGDLHWKETADKYFYIPTNPKKPKIGEWKPYDAILTPLIDASGKMIGLLTLDLPKDGSYPSRQLMEPIGLFASATAWAIQLSQFQRRISDQKDRTKSFIETISEELSKGHDLPTLGNVIVQVGEKFINVEGCNLYIVKENEVVLTHSSYLANTDYIGRHKRICSDPKCGLTGWVAKKGEPLLFNDEKYKLHPAWAGEKNHLSFLKSGVCKSLLLVPVKDDKNNVVAVISLENKKTQHGLGEFDQHDTERLVNIADQLSRALQRIGRYEAIRKWENRGLDDDLHFLINWYRFGVVANIEQLQDVINADDFNKAKLLLPELLQNARISVNELMELHTIIINDCLEAKSLKEGLLRLINAWSKRVSPTYNEDVPMQIVLNCPERLDLDIGLQNTMIRVASEALSNAISHSGIINNPDIQIIVEVKFRKGATTLNVIDNGVGMKIVREGLGIGKMKELAQKVNTLGGVESDWKIISRLNKGTRVSFSIKYLRDKNNRRAK